MRWFWPFSVLGAVFSCAGDEGEVPPVTAAPDGGRLDERAEAQDADPWRATRWKMVRDTIAAPADSRPRVTHPAVLQAMREVPRHRFVPESAQVAAYADEPLSIGHGQTISQPYMVAAMTELLDPDPDDVVLEIGTGSGYQAAVLAEIVRQVYTIEIVEPLGHQAAQLLEVLGYENILTKVGDGYRGWPEHAPFDAIVVTAAPDHVPQPLIDQLKVGGRLVIPVGPRGVDQELLLYVRGEDGSLEKKRVMPVRFVPLTGESSRDKRD